MAYTPAGGESFGQPNYSNAVPPKPVRQGDCASPNYVNENTFESGSIPASTAAIESNWSDLIDDDALDGASPMDAGRVAVKGMGEGIRGFRTAPVGGTNNPGNAK